ncbi:MAG: PASTA domain-containing protein, partial [Nocardioidaceae bacterium]
YEMGTGIPPYEGEVAQVLHQHLYGRVPAPSKERPELEPIDSVVLRATDPDPDQRYDTARQMRHELEAAIGVLGDAPPLSELTEELTSEVPGPSAETAVVELRRPSRRRRRWPALLLVLALLAGALLVLRPTRVPATAGQQLDAARRRLEAAGLEPKVQRVFSDSQQAGVVIGTRPGAGGLTRDRATVLLRVSKGPDVVAIPPVSGRSLDDASGLLRSQGFVVGGVERVHNPAPDGTVIEQNPRGGQVERRGSVVNLVVSSGPDLLGVPEVRGKTADEATKMLADSGFGATRTESFADAPAGAVLSQAPLPGERLERGQPVEITVSKGPEPFAMPEVTGQTCGEAKTRLEGLGLVVDVQARSGTCGTQRVLAQDPLPGARVQKGGQATLYA